MCRVEHRGGLVEQQHAAPRPRPELRQHSGQMLAGARHRTAADSCARPDAAHPRPGAAATMRASASRPLQCGRRPIATTSSTWKAKLSVELCGNTARQRARSRSDQPSSARPCSMTCPLAVFSSPDRASSKVLLPAPFGPSTPDTCPACKRRETPSSAVMPPRLTVRSLPTSIKHAPEQQEQKERRAEQRRDDADRQLGRCDHQPRGDIRQQQQGGAGERRAGKSSR